jgi:CheY-like chemotaxis protein
MARSTTGTSFASVRRSTTLPSFSGALVTSSEPAAQKLLLVEDNEDNRIIYSTVLRHLGYTVIEALDGLQAIALARSELPDLILMDISIPEVDGWEATRILRADPATKHIPIIALTAHALADDREKATAVGFTSYLAKPVEPRAVAAEVRRWIGRGAGAPPTAT